MSAPDAIDELDNAADCNTICNRYQDCVESCERSSDKDDRFMDRVDECEWCIDANACDITTKCEDECVGDERRACASRSLRGIN